jgi:hypothetical protein
VQIDEQAICRHFLFTYLTRASANEQWRRLRESSLSIAHLHWRLLYIFISGFCCIFATGMIWFFDRNGEKLRYEISHDRAAGRYRVIITQPDGTESVEELDEPTELIERSAELMNSLRGDGWSIA